MAISVISVSSDSSEDSMGTPAGRVILFSTIPTTIPDTTPVITPPTTLTDTTMIPTETPIITPTIPPSPDYTPASPDYSPASDSESEPSEDPSSDHIPPLPAILTFLSLADDTTDSDKPDSPPLPTHDSSSEASSDFHSDASSGSSSRHSLPDHSSPDLPSTSAGPSRQKREERKRKKKGKEEKRRRSPMTYVPALPPVSGALSLVHVDLIPSPKRVMDSVYLSDVEVDPRETSLRDDVIAKIDEYFAYAHGHRDRGLMLEFVVKVVDPRGNETGARGLVEVRVERVTHLTILEDIPEPAQEGAVEVIKGVQREQGHMIVGVESVVTALTERIDELKRDNGRLRGSASVESQRVDRLQRDMSRMQRELRQIRRFRYYN
ncbi:hypothetical protein Tco_1161964 [Tanacetum coccineum]